MHAYLPKQDFALLLQHTHTQADSRANGGEDVLLATIEWRKTAEKEAGTEFEDLEDVLNETLDIPSTAAPDAYGSARSKASSRQAKINATHPNHGKMGKWPNTNVDPEFAYLAHPSEILASGPPALEFARRTLPADKERSRMMTVDMDVKGGFVSGRRLYEEEVRKICKIADSPLSKPGVFRELSPPQRVVAELDVGAEVHCSFVLWKTTINGYSAVHGGADNL